MGLRGALAARGLEPGPLRLEIGERELIQDGSQVKAALVGLGAIDTQLAVDDFGASATSPARPSRIPMGVVELGGGFAGLRQREIVAAVIATAHGLGMSVVGAGIENAEQLAELNALACDDGQGFLLGRPLEEKAVADLLRGGEVPDAVA